MSFNYYDEPGSPPKRYFVISDLHLGFEYNLMEKGIQINSKFFTQEIVSEVLTIIDRFKPHGVILLGDIKDSIVSINSIERYHIPRFLKDLSKEYHVYLIPGNHDVKIEKLSPPDVSIASYTGITIGDTLFLHGHTMPSSRKSSVNKIVLGHLHPVLNKPDSNLNGERVWIFLRVKKSAVFKNEEGYLDLVTVPSINRFITPSNDFRRKNATVSISPLLRNATKSYDYVKQALVVCLDGYVLGDKRLLPFVT
ncbi:MAG: metallophosphoesterase [Nitrososphaeraceae archaeon]|nr:metallophosphoesterase [Nitrososphaeraceae archaeon]